MSLSTHDLKKLRDVLHKMETSEDISTVRELYKATCGHIQRRKAKDLKIGQRVLFTTKHGDIVPGNVVKVNRKTVVVGCDTGSVWKVSPTLIEDAAA